MQNIIGTTQYSPTQSHRAGYSNLQKSFHCNIFWSAQDITNPIVEQAYISGSLYFEFVATIKCSPNSFQNINICMGHLITMLCHWDPWVAVQLHESLANITYGQHILLIDGTWVHPINTFAVISFLSKGHTANETPTLSNFTIILSLNQW